MSGSAQIAKHYYNDMMAATESNALLVKSIYVGRKRMMELHVWYFMTITLNVMPIYQKCMVDIGEKIINNKIIIHS